MDEITDQAPAELDRRALQIALEFAERVREFARLTRNGTEPGPMELSANVVAAVMKARLDDGRPR